MKVVGCEQLAVFSPKERHDAIIFTLSNIKGFHCNLINPEYEEGALFEREREYGVSSSLLDADYSTWIILLVNKWNPKIWSIQTNRGLLLHKNTQPLDLDHCDMSYYNLKSNRHIKLYFLLLRCQRIVVSSRSTQNQALEHRL